MKAKWCSYRYKGTMTNFRWSNWHEHKTTSEMTADLKKNSRGMSVVQVVINPKFTGTAEGNELWTWRPGKGWNKEPDDTRNWYKDTCDPNCPPSIITDDDIFTGRWEQLQQEEFEHLNEYYNECLYSTITRSLEPALALDGISKGTEIPTDEQLAKHMI